MYAILDIESTGGQYNEEGIMEIAIYRFDGHDIVDRFMSLINPEREIQPFVSKLTGINNKMLRTAPKFHEVAKRIIEITEGAVVVAHNAQFDYRILRTEFRRLGYDFKRRTLCTVDLSQKLLPDAESHSLGKLVRSLGIPMSDRHRANGDALATLKLFKLLLAKDSDKSIVQKIMREAEHGELSANQLQIVSELPSKTGVYYMHDKDGEIIFLGRTKDIQKKVNQHFTNEGQLARKLQKFTKKVSFELTGSELISQLKEYKEIALTKPKYNQIPKKGVFSHALNFSFANASEPKLEIVKQKDRSSHSIGFNGIASAKSFVQRMTSNAMNGTGKGPLETSKENPTGTQNLREVFEKYSIQGKNLALFDKGRELGEQSFVLIKDGHLKGYGYVELNHQMNNIHILESLLIPMQSDKNTAYIVESYLRKKHRLKILELTPAL